MQTGLFEREAELGRIDALLALAQADRGGTLLITGPAGIGKSVLLGVARERALLAGMRVLRDVAGTLKAGSRSGLPKSDPAWRPAAYCGPQHSARPTLPDPLAYPSGQGGPGGKPAAQTLPPEGGWRPPVAARSHHSRRRAKTPVRWPVVRWRVSGARTGLPMPVSSRRCRPGRDVWARARPVTCGGQGERARAARGLLSQL